ncbi:MAG: Maf family nucleotide pyrophosphatase [Anaerolineae bacterium]
MPLILASSSPRRRELLSTLTDDFTIIKPEIDETQIPDEAPLDYVQRLSREKAQAVAERIDGDATILSADTVVILSADTIGIEDNGEILGKPADADEARAILARLRNRAHQVCTAFTVRRGAYQVTEVVRTTVHMRDYNDDEINAYIATGDPFDKAGSYAIQHEGFQPVRAIEGSHSNVVGLPVSAVRGALLGAGVILKDVPYRVKAPHSQVVAFYAGDSAYPPDLPPDIPLAFVRCVVRQGERYLLHYNPQRQQWEHAGGGIEVGEHPDQTAVRELFEETGQIARGVRCLGVMKIIYFDQPELIHYAPLYVGEIDDLAPFTPNEESNELALWDGQSALDGWLGHLTYSVVKFL